MILVGRGPAARATAIACVVGLLGARKNLRRRWAQPPQHPPIAWVLPVGGVAVCDSMLVLFPFVPPLKPDHVSRNDHPCR